MLFIGKLMLIEFDVLGYINTIGLDVETVVSFVLCGVAYE